MADSVPAPRLRDKASNGRGEEEAAWVRRDSWRAAPRRGRHLQEVRGRRQSCCNCWSRIVAEGPPDTQQFVGLWADAAAHVCRVLGLLPCSPRSGRRLSTASPMNWPRTGSTTWLPGAAHLSSLPRPWPSRAVSCGAPKESPSLIGQGHRRGPRLRRRRDRRPRHPVTPAPASSAAAVCVCTESPLGHKLASEIQRVRDLGVVTTSSPGWPRPPGRPSRR